MIRGRGQYVSNTHIVDMDPDLGDARIKNLDLSNGLEKSNTRMQEGGTRQIVEYGKQIKQFGIASQKDV